MSHQLLLAGHDEANTDLRYIKRKRRICRFVGHLWYEASYNAHSGRAVLECRRCWPHKDSILIGHLYDLLPAVDHTEAT